MNAFPNVTVVSHPLVQHKLTLLRRKEVSTAEFRRLVRELSLLLAYEVTRDLPLEKTAIETPLEPMQAPILAGKKLCFVRSEEHTSELQSLMRISYAVFCLNKTISKTTTKNTPLIQ